MSGLFENAEIIASYTRAEALHDGVLIDAGKPAREAGFRFPVALTAAGWSEAVAWTETNKAYQDEAGRLWDVLMMARLAAASGRAGDRRRFEVARIPNTPRATVPRLLELEMIIGPGDDAAPVITIGLPGED